MPELISPAVETPAGWYACYTRPRAEKKVNRLLCDQGVESYLPVVSRTSKWHDRNRTVVWPLFASYVFVRRGPALGWILRTPGVSDVVRFSGRPAVIPDAELRNVERFVTALEETGFVPPPVRFEEGQRVVITSGPFRGVEGVVLEVRGQLRVLVGLAAIGAGFEVDVQATSIKAVNGNAELNHGVGRR